MGAGLFGRAAAAARTTAKYLGTMATIAGAEALGVSMAGKYTTWWPWIAKGDTENIGAGTPYAIEERLARQMAERPRTLMRVAGEGPQWGGGE